MRYAKIRKMDISNGEGLGVSLFTQFCPHHCKNCFNQETWAIDGGKEWTKEIEDHFINLANAEHIVRVSILGGEPLSPTNVNTIAKLTDRLKKEAPNKVIWMYSGYTWENIIKDTQQLEAIKNIDILVDGKFVDELKDLRLKFKGSSNQRIINVQESLKQEEVVLHDC